LRFPRVPRTVLSGKEELVDADGSIASAYDFWRWAYSDLVSNSTRGVLAEFIVAKALACTGAVRDPWDATDLITPGGIRIEIKTSAYLQSWAHENESRICFSIRPSRAWSADTNVISDEVRRQADVYVFCLVDHKDKKTLDLLNLRQWKFFAVAASTLNEQMPTRKTISLEAVKRFAEETDFRGLEKAVRDAVKVSAT
jgi:hypothetical protein